ncbi:hypothetical protein ZWY2020_003762 [Hordeum vulgare]|nr:hypothetical protein ZWY2020_003762 [Hordeum vulgare]
MRLSSTSHSLPEDTTAVISPSPSCLVHKVQFAAAEDLSCPPIQHRNHGTQKPCLKKSLSLAINVVQGVSRPAAPSSPELLRTPSLQPLEVESSSLQDWQLVKAWYQWRALANNPHHPSHRPASSISPPTGSAFVKRHRRV